MFGDNLKKFRQDKGFSQNDIAEKLFVTRQCVSKWEKGITQPDLQTLSQLSDLLEVSVDELIAGNENNEENPPSNHNVGFFTANVLLSVFCLIAFILIWRFLPQRVPAHWTNGVIDRYGSRNEILLHLITVITLLSIDVAVFLAIKRTKSKKAVVYISHGVIAFFQVAYLIFIAVVYAKYLNEVISLITCLCIDLIACVSIAMHPKINKQNHLLGVRTEATLNSTAAWNKTNALASYLFTGFSLAILIINALWINKYSFLFLLIYVLLTVVVVVYAEKIGKAEERK